MASDWASLPAVLLETSLLMLSGPDAARAGCVCRYWRDALSIGDGSLWRSLCARCVGLPLAHDRPPNKITARV